MSAARSPRAQRAVFLDKDGTLIENVPHNVDAAHIRLAPGAEALPLLARAGFTLVVVSNQPGVARGLFPESALQGVEQRLRVLIAGLGATLGGFLYCPHDGAAGCACRKPAPGLLRRAATELGIDLAASWMVGDILDDVEAGHRAGCRTVLIDSGHETEWRPGALRVPDQVAEDLGEASRLIVETERRLEQATSAGGAS